MRQGFRPVLLFVVLVSGSVAGCVDGQVSDREGPAAVAALDPRVTLSYNMTGVCMFTELALPGSREEAQAFVPDGFEVADSQTPFGIVVQTCDGAVGSVVELVVPVRRPEVESRVRENMSARSAWLQERPLCDASRGSDFYYVAAYSSDRFWAERFYQANVPTVEAVVSQATVPVADAGGTAVVHAEGLAERDGAPLFSYDGVLHQGSSVRACRSTWFEAEHGLLVLDEVRRVTDGVAGAAVCDADGDEPFGWVVDEARCAQATAVVSSDVERIGYAFWFHETFVSR